MSCDFSSTAILPAWRFELSSSHYLIENGGQLPIDSKEGLDNLRLPNASASVVSPVNGEWHHLYFYIDRDQKPGLRESKALTQLLRQRIGKMIVEHWANEYQMDEQSIWWLIERLEWKDFPTQVEFNSLIMEFHPNLQELVPGLWVMLTPKVKSGTREEFAQREHERGLVRIDGLNQALCIITLDEGIIKNLGSNRVLGAWLAQRIQDGWALYKPPEVTLYENG